MRGRDEEAGIAADAYIDSLLARGRLPGATSGPPTHPADEVREAIDLLHAGLARFHPSFVFEETLRERLRLAAYPATARGEIVQLPLPVVMPAQALIDRRLLVGGAIASGVSLAGAAMLVRAAHHRRGRSRGHREWLA